MTNVTLPCINPNVSLGIDEACLTIVSYCFYPLIFYAIAQEAYQGIGVPLAKLDHGHNKSLIISTKQPQHLYFQTVEPNQNYDHCHFDYTFKEHGRYRWNLTAVSCPQIEILHPPTNSYLPFFAAFMVYVLLAILWTTSKVIVRVIRGKLSPDNVQDDLERLQETESTTHTVIRTTKSSTRIRSVDTFRGISILLMIFVNNGGGSYFFFNHSAWFGLTVADLVLPWFAWIMGLTITITKRAELRVTTSRIKITLRCLRRCLILILLGLMLNSMHSNSLYDLRFTGVLQLLAVSYFVCATLETIFMKPHSQDTLLQFGRFAMLRDILDSWPQWIIMICVVTIHTLITFLLPVPNCPTGYFGPGGKYVHRGGYMNCTAGAAGYIDRTIFGNHTYPKTMDPIYGPLARHDPEGLMNTIAAIFIVFLGVHAGKILLLYYQCNSRVIRWITWGAITGTIAASLWGWQHGIIPICKKMMTLPYVLICSSFAFFLYTILYVLIDYKQFWSGAPFIYAGTNPIFLYVGHILTKHLFPWSWNIAHPTHASALFMNLWSTTLWAIIAYLLYRKDIIITV